MKRVIMSLAALLCGTVLITTVAASDDSVEKCIKAKLDAPPLKTAGIRVRVVKAGIAEYAPYLSLPKANRYNSELRMIARGCGATKVKFDVDWGKPQPPPK